MLPNQPDFKFPALYTYTWFVLPAVPSLQPGRLRQSFGVSPHTVITVSSASTFCVTESVVFWRSVMKPSNTALICGGAMLTSPPWHGPGGSATSAGRDSQL